MGVSHSSWRAGAIVVVLASLFAMVAPAAAVPSDAGYAVQESSSVESLRTRHAGQAAGAIVHSLRPADDSLSTEMLRSKAKSLDPRPNQVIGDDERYQLSPGNPRVAFLEINGGMYTCSGTFIGPRVLLTAGHCLWGPDLGGFIESARVVPGKDSWDEPYGSEYAVTAWVNEGWVNSNTEDLTWDWGLLILGSDTLGNSVGHYTVGVLQTPTLQSATFNPAIVGYPGDKSDATQWKGQKGAFLEIDNFLLFHDIDTFSGQSGSAVFRGADEMVVGVHTNGTPTFNIAQRMDPEMLAYLSSGCEEMDCWFSSYIEASEPPPPPPPTPNGAIARTWERTDKPVADGQAIRTWMWGPQAFTEPVQEEYAESPNQFRTVQYFDKSRMEITDPNGDSNSIWYVTNGLLVVELVSGRLQLGDNEFDQQMPAQVNVAGDANDPTGPTYATMAGLRDDTPWSAGAVITARVDRDGNVTFDGSLAGYGVMAAELVDVPGIQHRVAAPFWQFMNSSGMIYANGQFVTAPLFENPYYATGFPITEAYWATVKVGGTPRDVLMQCFERRCLTYTPGNPVEWQVEMGNVGQHYYSWRYEGDSLSPECDAAYPDFCIPSPPPDLDCGDAPIAGHTGFTVLDPDPHGLDVDGDGIGCEGNSP